MVSAEERVQINRWAASPETWDAAASWFLTQSCEERRETLRETGCMALQAGCRPGDVDPASHLFHLKPSWTPGVLMSIGRPKTQLVKVLGLPENELLRAFALLLGLLSIADLRRLRDHCANGCQHWWHRDLEDEEIRSAIIDSGEAG